jgi:hypothetical protein
VRRRPVAGSASIPRKLSTNADLEEQRSLRRRGEVDPRRAACGVTDVAAGSDWVPSSPQKKGLGCALGTATLDDGLT